MDLFEDRDTTGSSPVPPLAERLRPLSLHEFVGQPHLLGAGRPLRVLIEAREVPSMILWGPPGSGKTTLARIIARQTGFSFHQLNAVSSGVKDVREVLATAERHQTQGRRTLLFIDEIHRFNKAQQDALLHSVEDGLIILIGATTENPSFEIISPLLSRCRLYTLQPLTADDLTVIFNRALQTDEQLRQRSVTVTDPDVLLRLSGGDARMLLNGLEIAVRIAGAKTSGELRVGRKEFEEAFQQRHILYDQSGEQHYNIVSAFIKSMRGGDPDAAVYWLARMLEGGEDPLFIARRMVILASEDVGNADPYGLTLATSSFLAVERVGMPEARIILAQAATYLASCPKSNAAYVAIDAALDDVRQRPGDPVPLHLRNAPTGFMAHLGYGSEYKYAHHYDGHFVEQQYLPDGLQDRVYYRPTDQGRERTIRERLRGWWKSKPL